MGSFESKTDVGIQHDRWLLAQTCQALSTELEGTRQALAAALAELATLKAIIRGDLGIVGDKCDPST